MTRTIAYILIPLIFLGIVPPASAQDFKVEMFRHLPNDVSAFINTVKDLNEEDCALIKVAASEDFAFSTPLGIVKRIDTTGEIWLYIPRKSKKITIKHPQYGVLRDYVFPEKIESLRTYEMKLAEPHPEYTDVSAVLQTLPVQRDTLILTKTDTLLMEKPRKEIPFSMEVCATYTIGGNTRTPMAGILVTAMKTHGAYLRAATDFGTGVKAAVVCDKNGFTDGYNPYYTGVTRNSAFQISAGGAHRLSASFNIFEGIGYGSNRRYWQLAESEGGGYARNSHYSYEGVLIEAGATVSFRMLTIAVALSSIEGRQWFGSIGIGIGF